MSRRVAHLCRQHAMHVKDAPGASQSMIDLNTWWPICGREPVVTNKPGRDGRRICKDCLRARDAGKDYARPEKKAVWTS